VGHAIVTNRHFVAYLCEIREAIELLFGVVSGVGPDNGVLDRGRHAPRGRGGFGDFLVHWIEWIFIVRWQNRNVCDSC